MSAIVRIVRLGAIALVSALLGVAVVSATFKLAPHIPGAPASVVTAPMVNEASVTTCKTTNSYKHTVTSKGTVTTTTEKRTSCGKAYQLWEHVTEHSYTGSHYTESIYKDERAYPHYRETIYKVATSAKGIITVTNQVKTG
jgi:hypothetical protein